jgi:hypothetical protein
MGFNRLRRARNVGGFGEPEWSGDVTGTRPGKPMSGEDWLLGGTVVEDGGFAWGAVPQGSGMTLI